jgi:DNA-binding IclR family transcriptional regulator
MNPARMRIFTLLCSRPCSGFNAISRALCLKPPTAVWHLNKLAEKQLIETRKVGRNTVFSPAGMVSPDDIGFFSLINAGKNRAGRLILILAKTPGKSATDVARQLGCPFQTALRALSKLRTFGLVRRMRDGRFARYYLSETIHGRYGFYRKRERIFRNALIRMIKADGLSPEIVRTSRGKVVLRISSSPEKGIFTFSLNPMESSLSAL